MDENGPQVNLDPVKEKLDQGRYPSEDGPRRKHGMAKVKQVLVVYSVSFSAIDELMETGLRGSRWAQVGTVKGGYPPHGQPVSEWLEAGGEMVFYDGEQWAEDPKTALQGKLTMAKLMEAFQRMLVTHPKRVEGLVTGKANEDVADELIQMAVFGEVVFG